MAHAADLTKQWCYVAAVCMHKYKAMCAESYRVHVLSLAFYVLICFAGLTPDKVWTQVQQLVKRIPYIAINDKHLTSTLNTWRVVGTGCGATPLTATALAAGPSISFLTIMAQVPAPRVAMAPVVFMIWCMHLYSQIDSTLS